MLPALLLVAIAGLAGCASEPNVRPTEIEPAYRQLPPRQVPQWLAGSVYEQVDLINVEPYRVSGFGLVVNLAGTGSDAGLPNAVRRHIVNEMAKRGFGSANQPGFERLSPEAALRDPRVSVVRVDAFIPPGARQGQRFDVQVSTLNGSDTTSLARGELWLTELAERGADPRAPAIINPVARARGPVFVDPEFALDGDVANPQHREALTAGLIVGGGRVERERPLLLRIRAAERRIARMTERRLDEAFRDPTVATAQDEGLVAIRVPERYGGDWEHFAQVALHTFFNADPAFAAAKAKQLADEARKPDAPLANLSYALEALGTEALPALQELMTDARPDVAFAAARAGALLGDGSAPEALAQMARTAEHPCRINAIGVLARLPATPSLNQLVRPLINDPEPTVRIAAARAMVELRDPLVVSLPLGEQFMMDVVPGRGEPLLFATRTGQMRLMLIGPTVRTVAPLLFTAIGQRLSISGDAGEQVVRMFYRGANRPEPVSMLSQADLRFIIARLAGEGETGPKFQFNYGEIVALLSSLSRQQLLTSAVDGSPSKVTFVLEAGQQQAAPEGPRPVADAEQARRP